MKTPLVNETANDIRVRIAPSPTGDWHLGNARTALFSYLFARKHNGKFYLRIEDTDQSRLVAGAVERLMEVLNWLGMDLDSLDDGQAYFVQSKNLARYQEIAEKLVADGHAYYCFANPEELEAMRQEQQAKKLPPRYDNRWGYRDLPLEEAKKRVSQGESYVVRHKMPAGNEEIVINDLIHGEVRFRSDLLDDYVLLKADGYPTYHLAHVVDDHDMQISHVIRGDEWLPSTPRHIVLHRHLGWNQPEYAHVPVILGPDKGKLSKRHGAVPIIEYKNMGYLPDAVLNFLLLLGWASGTEKEFYSRNEMIHDFSLERVHPSPAVFDKERLTWFNAHYIRNLSVAELVDMLKAYWLDRDEAWKKRYESNPEKFNAVVSVLHDRITTLEEFSELAEPFYVAPGEYSLSLLATKKQSLEDVKPILTDIAELLKSTNDWTHEGLETKLRGYADAHGIKAGEVLWPVRAALTGLPASPGVFEMLIVLGKEESLARLNEANKRLAS